jgi:hypothetical protein
MHRESKRPWYQGMNFPEGRIMEGRGISSNNCLMNPKQRPVTIIRPAKAGMILFWQIIDK